MKKSKQNKANKKKHKEIAIIKDTFSNIEKCLVSIILICLLFFTYYSNMYFSLRHGDTALYCQILESISKTGKPLSGIGANILDYVYDSGALTIPHNEYGENIFNAEVKPVENYFKHHFNPVLYIFAPLTVFAPSETILNLMESLTFLAIPLAAYIFLRKKNIPWPVGLCFCLLIIIHPAWSSSLSGQIYPDRFFMLFAFLAACFMMYPQYKVYLLLSCLGCALTGERGMLIGGALLIGYAVLFWEKPLKGRLFNLIVGFIMIVLGVVTLIALTNPNYYSGGYFPKSLNEFINRLSLPGFKERLFYFFILNIVLMGLIALFNWRAFLIALGSMIPNILGNIGGAEKDNYFVHYHSYYYPILIWACMVAVINLYNLLQEKSIIKNIKLKSLNRYFLVAPILTIALIISSIAFNNLKIVFRSPVENNFIISNIERIFNGNFTNQIISQTQLRKQFQSAVPENSLVSSTESGCAFLYHNRDIQLFPMGIDNADYAVIIIKDHLANDPVDRYQGAATFLGKDESEKINRLTIERMIEDNYDFDNAVELMGQAIIKRIH